MMPGANFLYIIPLRNKKNQALKRSGQGVRALTVDLTHRHNGNHTYLFGEGFAFSNHTLINPHEKRLVDELVNNCLPSARLHHTCRLQTPYK